MQGLPLVASHLPACGIPTQAPWETKKGGGVPITPDPVLCKIVPQVHLGPLQGSNVARVLGVGMARAPETTLRPAG